MGRFSWITLVSISVVGAACSGAGERDAALAGKRLASTSASRDLVTDNGISLNGISLNGISLNGISLNGISLNGTTLTGVNADGQPISGPDFVGATLTGVLSDGRSIQLHIDAVPSSSGDLSLYQVSLLNDGRPQPLCGVGADGSPVLAMALAGRWDYRQGVAGGGDFIDDPDQFTFACQGHAIAKCVDLGYQPWQSAGQCDWSGCHDVSLRNHHQACTRLLRADYCGDGSAHTVDGTRVNLYDGLGIQQDTEDWKFEAEWDASGAICVKSPRYEDLVPSCAQHLHRRHCGALSHFWSGTLLMNEHERGQD